MEPHDGLHRRVLFYTSANAAWGSDPSKYSNSWKDYRCNYNTHLRTMDIDSGIEKYEDLGSTPNVGVVRHLKPAALNGLFPISAPFGSGTFQTKRRKTL